MPRRRLFGGRPRCRAKPGKEDALRAATLPLMAQVRGDPEESRLLPAGGSRATPGHFIFYEIFATKADFEAHNAMPYVKDVVREAVRARRGGVEVMRMEVLGTS